MKAILSLGIAVGLVFLIAVFQANDFISYATESNEWDEFVQKCGVTVASGHEDEAVDVIKENTPLEEQIEAFAASEDMIAILFTDYSLGIFTPEMQLISSFRVELNGSLCGLMIDGSNVVLFPGRSDYATEIDEEGKLVAVYTYDSNSNYEDYVWAKERETRNYSYYVSNQSGRKIADWWQPFEYPRLVQMDYSGETRVVYDASEKHILSSIADWAFCFAIAVFIAGFLYVFVYRKFFRTNNGHR